MPERSTTPVRIPVTARDAVNRLCVKAVPEIGRMIGPGEMISALSALGESHFSEVLEIMKGSK